MEKLEPRIRFSGFGGEWKKEKFINFVEKISGNSDDINLPRVEFEDIKSGHGYLINDIYDKDNKDKIGTKFKSNDVLFGKLRPYLKNWLHPDFEGIAIGDFWVLRDKHDNSNKYLYSLIQSDKFNYIANISTGTKMPRSDWGLVSNTYFNIPGNDEQEKIGSLFEKFDSLIEKQEKYLDLNKRLKDSLLQKAFPKEKNINPNIRFNTFKEKWELTNLGDICDITTGKLDANAMVEDGIYDFYTSGIKKYKINSYEFEGPAITIAGNGATVGYMHLADGKFNAYQRTYVLSNFKQDRFFTYKAIAKSLPKKIHEESRAGNIPYIVLNMLTNLKIHRPQYEEQEKIGSLFKSLDEKIEKEEKKLKLYKSLKKSLLQKMFI